MVTKPIHKTTTKAKSLLAKLAAQPKAPAIINISELLVLQGELDSALKKLGDVKDTYVDSYRYHLVSARANRDAGKYEQAQHHYEVACRLAPQNEVAIKELVELCSIPSGTLAPDEEYDTEVLSEQEEACNDDFSDIRSRWTSDFDRDRPEPVSSILSSETTPSPAPPGLFLDDTNEETQEEPTQRDIYASAGNIFEPNIDGPNEIENTEDLFLPEGEGEGELDLERMQQEAISDLFSSSSFSPEALQREAIRQIEIESGPISDDPFTDFESDRPVQKRIEEQYFKDPKELFSPSIQNEDLSKTGSPDKTSDITGQSGIGSDESLFVGFDDERPSQESNEFEYNLEDDDLADFKLDKAKLAQALSKLQSGAGDQETNSDDGGSSIESETAATAESINTGFQLDDLDKLAADLSNLKFQPIEETNDPTPISEQRKPYSDEEVIKMPTRSLAQIFVSQGAYAKAIKVYEALIENDPENAIEYQTEIAVLQQKMTGD